MTILGSKKHVDVLQQEPPSQLSIDNAMDGIHTLDANGNVVAVNQAFCDMLGYSHEELLAMNVRDWDAQWSGDQIPQKINEVLQQRQVFETKHRRKDGRVIDVEIAVAAASLEQGIFLFASARDISARKLAEARLRESEEQFRSLVEQAIAGLYVIQDGRIAYANARFAEIFGYSTPAEVIGLISGTLVAPEDRETADAKVRRRLKGESKRERFAFRGIRQDGSPVEVGADGAVATYRNRPAIVGLVQDISERKESEQQIARYIAKLESALRGTVRVASTMSEMRDPYTAGHERRVGEIAAAIGRELGLEDTRVEGLRVTGSLHDIGKISVPAEILSKPSRLSDVEFALIKQHPTHGHAILKDVEFPWPVAQTVLQHHERLDGSGYPQGLKGDAILLEARILAVADTIEAMGAHRPYRAAVGLDYALTMLEADKGSKYDTTVVDACLRLFRKRGYTLPA